MKKGGDDIVHMFVHDYLRYIHSIQIWWTWNILKNKGVCINPITSMVKNIGFDGTGTHYNKSVEKSETIIINKRKLKKLNFLLYDEKISKSFNNYFKISYKLKIIYTIFPIHLIIYGYKILDFCSNFFKNIKIVKI